VKGIATKDYLRGAFHTARARLQVWKRRRIIRREVSTQGGRVIVGSGATLYDGWLETDRNVLNILNPDDWKLLFNDNSLDAILAEHVWEHFTAEEGLAAAVHCFQYLKPGGYIRVAVPDGFHPDNAYIEDVRPGGSGAGAKDHKVLYTYRTFSDVFTAAGFEVFPKEYFNESGYFVENHWAESEGMICRSKRFDARNKDGQLRYTSIVLDAVKPIV
jgi:predicted SAM-dependent methyltransferase